MKAVIHKKYGPPSVLEILNIDKPIPKNNEILIRVYATTVNRTDCAMLRAKPFIMRFFTGFLKPSKPILGTDFAGQIEALGSNVTSFKIGDRVFGLNDSGLSSHSQFMSIQQDKAIVIMPSNCSYQEAAASLEGVHYAYNILKKINILKGQKTLVNGATGAIGSALVQILKYYGAHITAVCNTKNITLVKSLGANVIIDYQKEDFTQLDEKYDFVFDAVGKSSFSKCKPLLQNGGIYISTELGWMAENIFYALLTPFISRKKVKFPIPTDCKISVLFIKKLIEEGFYKAVIDKTFLLSEIADAFTYVEKGEKTGNVVIILENEIK